MKENAKKILEDYQDNIGLYNSFNNKCRNLIIDLLTDEKVNYHQITERIKESKKLEEKISRKEFKYKSIGEITDVCGIRIITFFEDEVDKIADIIKSAFIIDTENSIDKRQLESDRFGYRSLHYVVSLKPERIKLPEYKKFAKLKVEIQIRTILQHSWAEIEHDIGYKGEIAIPEIAKRTFYRVAALLETADIEFVQLKNLLKNYEINVGAEILKNPESVLLDQASLLSYMESNPEMIAFDKRCSEFHKVNIEESDIDLSVNMLLERLKKVGILTIKQLDDIIQNKSEELFNKYIENTKNLNVENISSISLGMALYQIDTLL